jgi:hypothetical protein
MVKSMVKFFDYLCNPLFIGILEIGWDILQIRSSLPYFGIALNVANAI